MKGRQPAAGSVGQTARKWFSSVGDVTIFVSDGWYGAPFDNAHFMTELLHTPSCLAIAFDRETVVAAFGDVQMTIDDIAEVATRVPRPPSPSRDWSTLLVRAERIVLSSAGDDGEPTLRGFGVLVDYVVLVGPRQVDESNR